MVGAPLRAELPAFSDPGGKTLALHVTPSPPPGLAFHDLGGGRGLIEGTPTQAGGYDFEVVAINPHGKSAHMKVALLATGAPPKPALSVVDLEPATLGSPYSAALPPFRSPERLKLRAEPLPAGLAFADLGGGLSQLAGQPAKAGRFHFDIVAAAASGGAEARTTVNLEVRPAPTPTTSVDAAAPPTPLATTAAFTAPPIETFLREFDGGSCFAVRSQDGGQGVEFAAIGADRAAFQRFEAAYRNAYRREPDVRASLVLQEQCPAADLLRQSAASAPPQLTLDTTDVGKGRPLAGAITALRGRALLLLAIVDDGRAVKLRTQISPNGETPRRLISR